VATAADGGRKVGPLGVVVVEGDMVGDGSLDGDDDGDDDDDDDECLVGIVPGKEGDSDDASNRERENIWTRGEGGGGRITQQAR
jgi:hypothetical protein